MTASSHGVSFWSDDDVLNSDSSDGCTPLRVY